MKKRVFPSGRGAFLWGVLFFLSLGIPFDPFFLYAWVLALGSVFLLFLADWIWLAPWRRAADFPLKMAVQIAPFVGRNQETPFSLRLENRLSRSVYGAWRPVFGPAVEAQKTPIDFFLNPGEIQTMTMTIRPKARGEQKILETCVRCLSPLKLWNLQLCRGASQSFFVLPNLSTLLPDRGILAPRLSEMGIKSVRLRGVGTDFDSLRRYVPGDNYRHIDWRSTAKRAQLMTRTYQVERNHDILLAVDCGRRMATPIDGVSKLDWTMDSATAVAAFLLHQKDAVGLYLFGSSPQAYLPPKKDPLQLRRLCEAMAKASLETRESHFLKAATYLSAKRSKRTLAIFFTDFLDRETSLGLISGLFHLNRRHCILFVGVADPFIPQAIEGEVSPEASPFHKAVAFEMRRRRLEVMDLLEKAGMSVLDLEPRRLTTPVLLRYLDLKMGMKL